MNPYYIYALKDPRTTPAVPFYVGKGTGVRAWEHTLKVDSTRKGKRIAEIHAAGHSGMAQLERSMKTFQASMMALGRKQ
ncbi:hypothetical protein CR159_12735 [Pollutimonas subterranea]|uniref:GIY-YIG domain-containing protein n=1 Tax=Pollutimonas subterranea TaxID=2045210 RepID=A0A2N4U372_9BURK|nr:hypothetical protein [Pollutimonas subterranea]PLC49465.1 hypothetical protein CR159_12735 [Pollutimonas subterranea]